MKSLARLTTIGLVLCACVGCDQVTKLAAQRHFAGHDPLSLFWDTVRLSYVENPGAFLGLGEALSSSARFWLLGVMVALVLVILAVRGLTDRAATPVRLASILMIIAGGVGNLIDRASLGVVRDFLNIGIGSIRTGIFNMADVDVTVGAALFALSLWHSPNGTPSDRTG